MSFKSCGDSSDKFRLYEGLSLVDCRDSIDFVETLRVDSFDLDEFWVFPLAEETFCDFGDIWDFLEGLVDFTLADWNSSLEEQIEEGSLDNCSLGMFASFSVSSDVPDWTNVYWMFGS